MDHHDLKNMRYLDSISCLVEGDVVVDVGACDGTYTNYFFQKVRDTGKIYAFELNHMNCYHLQKTFRGLNNVEIIYSAISDECGELPFYAGSSKEEWNIVGHNTSFQTQDMIGKIKSTTLNEELKDEPKTKLVKIDVEGAELKVLKGMSEVVDRVDYILLENHFDEDWPEIRKIILEDYGFSCYNIEKESEVTIDSPRPYQCLCKRKT